jgi:UrcA family protein
MLEWKPLQRHALLAGAGLLLMAAPAFAQSTVGEITVTGRFGEASRLSAPVSYADLDLTLKSDQDVLKTRIKDTAKDLCRQLGEANQGSSPLVPTCEEGAWRDAQKQMTDAIAMAPGKTRTSAAVNPPATDSSATEAAPIADTTAAAPPAVDASSVDRTAAEPATVTVQTVTNGPVADTPANRVKYGQPLSRAGRMTQPAGN